MNWKHICSMVALGLGMANPLQSGEIPWSDTFYYHFAQDQDLASLIKDFTAVQGVDVVISPELVGTVNGIFENIPPQEFWNNLTKVYNVMWFYDGNVLYAYPGADVQTEVLTMGKNDADSLIGIINDLDFASSNSSMRYLPENRMLVVNGTPRFLQVLQTFINKVQVNTIQNLADETVVQIFPLKYAFAYDIQLDVGSGVTVEGVSTLLQRIISGVNNIPSPMNSPVNLSGQATVQPVEGVLQKKGTENLESSVNNIANAAVQKQAAKIAGTEKLTSAASSAKNNDIKTAQIPSEQAKEATRQKETDLAPNVKQSLSQITSITYDARLNAVIIRDRKELMPFYQSLIERFDIPTKAIEIQVAIVDVDVGKTRKLGVDAMQFANPDSKGSLTIRPLGNDATIDNKNASFFGQFTNVMNGWDVLGRVQALESASAAKTLSRPSVLTLDNLAAVISQTNETYVAVAGSFSSDLFTVSASISLRVIPHIINEELPDGTIQRKLKMFVNITDGSVSAGGGTSGMPSTNSSQINTQSVLYEGQSLVVGGYYRESHSNNETGIPFLRKLPVLGHLFKLNNRITETVERLFIISPKIIELSADQESPYNRFFQPNNLSGKPSLNMEQFTLNSPYGKNNGGKSGNKTDKKSHSKTSIRKN